MGGEGVWVVTEAIGVGNTSTTGGSPLGPQPVTRARIANAVVQSTRPALAWAGPGPDADGLGRGRLRATGSSIANLPQLPSRAGVSGVRTPASMRRRSSCARPGGRTLS